MLRSIPCVVVLDIDIVLLHSISSMKILGKYPLRRTYFQISFGYSRSILNWILVNLYHLLDSLIDGSCENQEASNCSLFLVHSDPMQPWCNPLAQNRQLLAMLYSFRHQPWKGLYLTYQLFSTVFIRFPLWIICNIPPWASSQVRGHTCGMAHLLLQSSAP